MTWKNYVYDRYTRGCIVLFIGLISKKKVNQHAQSQNSFWPYKNSPLENLLFVNNRCYHHHQLSMSQIEITVMILPTTFM